MFILENGPKAVALNMSIGIWINPDTEIWRIFTKSKF